MIGEKKILWAVRTNSDLTEGRGRSFVKHFCECKATAERLAKRGYVQGSDCPVEPVEVLVLEGQHVLPLSVIRVEPPTDDDLKTEARTLARQNALQKAKDAGLSDEEIDLIQAKL